MENKYEISVFDGRATEKMPELLNQGYKPITIKKMMNELVNGWQNNNLALEERCQDNYFDCGDSIVYNSNGNIKIVLDSKSLRELNQTIPLRCDGGIPLSQRDYDDLNAQEFTREDVIKYGNKQLSKNNVFKNPIWLALVGNNADLLKEFAMQHYARCEEHKSMKIWIDEKVPTTSIERCLSFCNFDSRYEAIGVNIGNGLNYEFGRLTGIKYN